MARSRITAILFFVLLGVVALTPLPLGSNRPWAWEVLGVVIGLLMTSSSLDQLLNRSQPRASIAPLKVSAFLFAVVIGWAAIQCLPFTPDAWHHPLWSQAQDYLGPQIFTSVSVNRITSISHIFRLITYAGIFWLSYSFCHDANRARTAMKAVSVIVAVYAVWGLFVYWTGNTT